MDISNIEVLPLDAAAPADVLQVRDRGIIYTQAGESALRTNFWRNPHKPLTPPSQTLGGLRAYAFTYHL